MKMTATQMIEMLSDMTMFRLHLDRLKDLETVALETNAEQKRNLMLKVAKDACMWSPRDPSEDDLRRLYALARAAVVAEGNARTAEFRKKHGIEISTLTPPE